MHLSIRKYRKLKKDQEGPARTELTKEDQEAFARWLLAKVQEPGLTTVLLYTATKKDWGVCSKTMKRFLAEQETKLALAVQGGGATGHFL